MENPPQSGAPSAPPSVFARERIVEFAHIGGVVDATRRRVESEIELAVIRTGTARLLEWAGLSDSGTTTLWESFLNDGSTTRPVTHVAVVVAWGPMAPRELLQHEGTTVRFFPDSGSARQWLMEAQ